RNHESHLALAGGVLALINESALVKVSQIEMLSPSGRCRTFDESGDGMVLSEGLGVIVLKRLEDAIADRDSIYTGISASGMNQDGASNGITAPSGTAQEKLITSVYRRHRINAEPNGVRASAPADARGRRLHFLWTVARTYFGVLPPSCARRVAGLKRSRSD